MDAKGAALLLSVARMLSLVMIAAMTVMMMAMTLVITTCVPRGQGQAALLAPPKTSTLRAAEIRSEKERSFDLLDALSCSGASNPR